MAKRKVKKVARKTIRRKTVRLAKSNGVPPRKVLARLRRPDLQNVNNARDMVKYSTELLVLSRQELDRVWTPLKEHYRLPNEVELDRTTGEIFKRG